MAKNVLSKREDERQVTRRALIKWSVAAGAALGVSRSKIFEILEKTAGKDVAFAASASTVNNSVFFEHGNGGLSWMTQLFPFAYTATSTAAFGTSGNISLCPTYQGKITSVAGTNGTTIYQTPTTPFLSLPAAQQVTSFACGQSLTHNVATGLDPVMTLNGANIISICAALQSQAPSVVPLIVVGSNAAVSVNAAGAPNPTTVSSGAGIADLFNSAASSAGGILAKASDATLYKAQYETFFQLNRVAGLSTTRIGFTQADGAAGLLGTNLSSVLTITAADLARYQITSTTDTEVQAIGQSLIIAVKAFKMGLMTSIYISGMANDPHPAFADGTINTTPVSLQAVYNAFYADLLANTDDNTGETLASKTVLGWFGDTFKNPVTPSGWTDNTPGGSNMIYLMGNGYAKSGNYGGLNTTDPQNKMDGFDGNGNLTVGAFNGAQQLSYALGTVAYCIAKGDARAIETLTGNVDVTPFTVDVQT